MRKGLFVVGVLSGLLFLGVQDVEARGGGSGGSKGRGGPPSGGSSSGRSSSGHSGRSSSDHSSSGPSSSGRSYSQPSTSQGESHRSYSSQGPSRNNFASSPGSPRHSGFRAPSSGGIEQGWQGGRSATRGGQINPGNPGVNFVRGGSSNPAQGQTARSGSAATPSGPTQLGSASEFFRGGRSGRSPGNASSALADGQRTRAPQAQTGGTTSLRRGTQASPLGDSGPSSRGDTRGATGTDLGSRGAAQVGNRIFGHGATRQRSASDAGSAGSSGPTTAQSTSSGNRTRGLGGRGQGAASTRAPGGAGVSPEVAVARTNGGGDALPSVFGSRSGRRGAVNTSVIGNTPGTAVTGGRVNRRDYVGNRHGGGNYHHNGYHHDHWYGHGHGHGHGGHHSNYGWSDAWWGFGLGFTLGYAATWPGYYWAWGTPYSYYNTWYGGSCFGYAVSWYDPSCTQYFVQAVPYQPPTQVILEQPVVIAPQQAPAPQGLPQEDQGGFPEPAPAQEDAATPQPNAQAPALHPDFDPGVKAFLAGNYAMAEARFLRVAADEPENGEALLGLMQARFARGDYAAAAVALNEAAQLGAFPRGYRFDPRPLYPQEGSYERALSALDQHLEAQPRDADAWLVRAYLHVALAERAQAREAIDKVLAARADDPTAPELALALLPALPPPQKGAK